jgi:hypothetical protein
MSALGLSRLILSSPVLIEGGTLSESTIQLMIVASVDIYAAAVSTDDETGEVVL